MWRRSVPANARITVRGGHGDISVRGSDEAEVRVNGKKNVRSWNQTDAQRVAGKVGVEVVKNGDGYEVQPTSRGDSRVRGYGCGRTAQVLGNDSQ